MTLIFGALHREAFFSPRKSLWLFCSCLGETRACKFHSRKNIFLHPHQEGTEHWPKHYKLDQTQRFKEVESCKKRKLSLAENFSEEVFCANIGLKEKYSTLLDLQGRQRRHWLCSPPQTNGSLPDLPKQTSHYTLDIRPPFWRPALPVSGSCAWCNLKRTREIIWKFLRQSMGCPRANHYCSFLYNWNYASPEGFLNVN